MQMTPPDGWPDPKIRYMSHLEFTSERVHRSVKRQCRIAKFFNALSDSAEWLGELYGNEINKAHSRHIRIEYINEKIGHGVFANQDLPTGCFIGLYTGGCSSQKFIF